MDITVIDCGGFCFRANTNKTFDNWAPDFTITKFVIAIDAVITVVAILHALSPPFEEHKNNSVCDLKVGFKIQGLKF